jgi:hypothetical protein
MRGLAAGLAFGKARTILSLQCGSKKMNNNTDLSALLSARIAVLASKAIWLSSNSAQFGSSARRHLH